MIATTSPCHSPRHFNRVIAAVRSTTLPRQRERIGEHDDRVRKAVGGARACRRLHGLGRGTQRFAGQQRGAAFERMRLMPDVAPLPHGGSLVKQLDAPLRIGQEIADQFEDDVRLSRRLQLAQLQQPRPFDDRRRRVRSVVFMAAASPCA